MTKPRGPIEAGLVSSLDEKRSPNAIVYVQIGGSHRAHGGTTNTPDYQTEGDDVEG